MTATAVGALGQLRDPVRVGGRRRERRLDQEVDARAQQRLGELEVERRRRTQNCDARHAARDSSIAVHAGERAGAARIHLAHGARGRDRRPRRARAPETPAAHSSQSRAAAPSADEREGLLRRRRASGLLGVERFERLARHGAGGDHGGGGLARERHVRVPADAARVRLRRRAQEHARVRDARRNRRRKLPEQRDRLGARRRARRARPRSSRGSKAGNQRAQAVERLLAHDVVGQLERVGVRAALVAHVDQVAAAERLARARRGSPRSCAGTARPRRATRSGSSRRAAALQDHERRHASLVRHVQVRQLARQPRARELGEIARRQASR